MFCTDCRNGDSKYSSQYTTGCESMKLDSINRHENSTNHKNRQAECLAAKREKNAEPEAGQTEATRAKQMWVHNMKPELFNKFRNAHFVAKYNGSLSMYGELNKLDYQRDSQEVTTKIPDMHAMNLLELLQMPRDVK